MRSATIGISTLLLTKSNISRIESPPMLMKTQTPKPSDEGIPKTTQPMKTAIQVKRLPQPNLSLKMDTTVYIREMEDVSAAKNTIMKNTAPMTAPPGIVSKTLGKVSNISVGPLPSFSVSPL